VNTRIDAGREYPGKDSVRLVATDTSNASDDWIAVAAPRVPVTVPFTSLIGHDQPAALDWAMADRKARQSGVPDTTSAITQDTVPRSHGAGVRTEPITVVVPSALVTPAPGCPDKEWAGCGCRRHPVVDGLMAMCGVRRRTWAGTAGRRLRVP